MSLSDTRHPISPCAISALGAAASHWFIEPHSSDSTCPNVIHRSDSSGMTLAAASETRGNIWRGPQ